MKIKPVSRRRLRRPGSGSLSLLHAAAALLLVSFAPRPPSFRGVGSDLGFGVAVVQAKQVERKVTILNESGHRVEMHWVAPNTGERVLQTTPHMFHGASFNLNSYVSHHFELRELPNSRTGLCGDSDTTDDNEGSCRVGYFTVNENEDQIVFIRRGMEVEHTDSKSIAKDSAEVLLSECQRRAAESISNTKGSVSADEAKKSIEDLVACVEARVAGELERSNEEVAFQASIRTKMAEHLENYTCADEELPTTEPIQETTWINRGAARKVQVLHDRPSAKVHLISNFITEDECEAMEDAARPLLHKATVADGKGGSRLSESRKALQAGIKVPWEKEKDGNGIATVSRKVYDYVNHVLDLDIREDGQEDLMSIQYEGRGDDDEEPDRYMPHCDGDCTGLEFKPGNRMATVVIYCTVPARGGATNFRNAGLHIVPEKGSATFFSYLDPETMKMDSGFTEHSGCPVIEGEKKIVTQWVRLGVDKENPWDSFNTLGIRKKDAQNQ